MIMISHLYKNKNDLTNWYYKYKIIWEDIVVYNVFNQKRAFCKNCHLGPFVRDGQYKTREEAEDEVVE